MTGQEESTSATVRWATVCCFAMIAAQIGSKAVRDALFLSGFGIEALPAMVIGAATASLVFVLLASRMLDRQGPGRLVPSSFLFSAVVLCAVAVLNTRLPRVAAVILYLHVAILGAILVSWFWSLLNESFDARAGRRSVSRIAAGGTFGGLLGGLVAERVGSIASPGAMLPILALLHAVCALLAMRITTRATRAPQPRHDNDEGVLFGLRVLQGSTYLRTLALLVLLGTLGATLLDFAFKAQATRALADSRALLRFFAIFYTVTALVAFLVQSVVVSRLLKSPQDLSRTVSLLPWCLAAGALLALLFPGLVVVTLARGIEGIMRNSAFRSSYEIFFNPLPPRQKRATKTIIDVGGDRLGDLLGGLLVQGILLLFGVALALPYLLGLALAIGLFAVWRARRLHGGYVAALAGVIRDQVTPEPRSPHADHKSLELFRSQITSLQSLGLEAHAELAREAARPDVAATEVPRQIGGDPARDRLHALRSRQPERVRAALLQPEDLDVDMVQAVIPLLAWDLMARAAIDALRRNVTRHTHCLVDAMLDPESDFAIRRRIPAILVHAASPAIVEALLRALSDARFEVRYQAALALARIHHRSPDLPLDRDRVLQVITQETHVDQKMWNRRRLLDEVETEGTPFYREVLRNRTHRSLEHVFHLLSLAFPAAPLRVAYDGLHTGDPTLRGTALEYLESILPEEVRHSLWPLLGTESTLTGGRKTEKELLDSLMLSHQSILLQLKDLQDRSARE